MLVTMKDKKTITIVTLAAITAGFAIFSFVNNTNKLKANSKLEEEKISLNEDLQKIRTEKDQMRTQRDQLDAQSNSLKEKVAAQVEQIAELNTNVKTKGEELNALAQKLSEKSNEIESVKLQHAQDLGEAESNIKAVTENLAKVEGELKAQKEIAEAKTKEAEERGDLVSDLELKNKDLNQEKTELEQERAKLQAEIEKTSKLLEHSREDREALGEKLAVLEKQKEELDRQMADIFFIEAKYKAIRSELAVAKRMDWMRRGIGVYSKDPAKRVGTPINQIAIKSELKQDVKKGLDSVSVELTSDGRVIIDGKVVEPAQAEKSINAPKE